MFGVLTQSQCFWLARLPSNVCEWRRSYRLCFVLADALHERSKFVAQVNNGADARYRTFSCFRSQYRIVIGRRAGRRRKAKVIVWFPTASRFNCVRQLRTPPTIPQTNTARFSRSRSLDTNVIQTAVTRKCFRDKANKVCCVYTRKANADSSDQGKVGWKRSSAQWFSWTTKRLRLINHFSNLLSWLLELCFPDVNHRSLTLLWL